MVKVLHLIPYSIHATRTGGPAVLLNNLVKFEQPLGHNIEIGTTTGNLDEDIRLTVNGEYECIVENSIPTYYFKRKNYLFPPTFYYAPTLSKFLKKRINSYDIVIIHEIWTYLNWIGARISNKAGKPYILFCHGSFDPWAFRHHGLKKKIYWEIYEKQIFRNSSGIVTLNGDETNQIRELGIDKPFFQIKNGIIFPIQLVNEPELILRKNIPELGDHQYILFIGRLHQKKGIEILLEAWAQISADFPDHKLVIAGPDEGAYLSKLQALSKKLEIKDGVLFPGLVTGELKSALLQRASIFTLTSFSEGIPGAVIEAMAYKLPVLITPGCHLPEVTKVNAGLIVEPKIEDVSRGLKTLLENQELRIQMGRNGEKMVKIEFDERKIAEEFVSFCDSILHRGIINPQ